MNSLAAVRHRHRSVIVLGVALYAWLATPCAVAVVSGAPASETRSGVGIHDHCPNSKLMIAVPDTDCCCDLSAVLSGESPELFTPVILTALPIDRDPFNPTLSDVVPGYRQKPPLHETSPPVYLATQRLRI
ncbi:MAG: hypothetical protein ACE5OQ_01615 [Woeseia sp.]